MSPSTIFLAAALAVAGSSGTSYSAYLGGPAHDSFASSATTITTSNAASIKSAWTWTPVKKGSLSTYLNASPIEYDGVIYIGSETGDFYAVSAKTGKSKWRVQFAMDDCASQGVVSSATVATDPTSGVLTVYVGAPDHYLYALNAASGKTIWKTLIGEDNDTYFNWSSPTVANGYVYYGVSTACGNAGYDGVVALNQQTGAQTGVYYTGGSPTQEGASVHTSVAVAPDGSVWVSTGNDNGTPPSLTDTTAIVKLAGGTLARLGGYQVPGLYGLDSDFMASPMLFTDGTTPMVGACNKDGVFYALDQSAPNTLAWSVTIGLPPVHDSLAYCGDAAVWNGTNLYLGSNGCSSSQPSCGDPSAAGGMYELSPSGDIEWYTPLEGPVVGGVSLDGSGVLAVPTYNSKSGAVNALYLIEASTGTILKTINYSGPIFAQPIFADNELLVAGPSLQAYRP
jgi:outer membrane protein assembly factor BamB